MIDVTWIHKLSGIGKTKKGYYASLDGKEYMVGDSFHDMKIIAIERLRVICRKEVGTGYEDYYIGFRR